MYSKICDVNEHLDGLPLSEPLLSVIQARDQILQSAQPEKTVDISRRLYWLPRLHLARKPVTSAVFSGYKGPITPSARVHVFQLMTIRFDLHNFHYVSLLSA